MLILLLCDHSCLSIAQQHQNAQTLTVHNFTLRYPTVRSSLTLNKSHQLFKSYSAVSNQIVLVVPSYPSHPPIAAGTMLGICVIPVVVLYCSAHVYCAVEHGVACCAIYCIAIATLTLIAAF